MVEEAVIVRAKRTPICKKNGRLQHLSVHELLVPLFQAVGRDVTKYIDDVIVSNAVTPGGNVARLAALSAGFPDSVTGVTLDRQCSGGLDAVRLSAALIESGMGACYLVGAVESPSTISRPRAVFSPPEIGDPEMPAAAEYAAKYLDISRDEQDAYTLRTYKRAWAAFENGFFRQEIVPVAGCCADEAFARKRPMERLVLRAVPLEAGGSITAANSCGFHDGAAVLLVMSRSLARRLSLVPRLAFVSGVVAGFSPLIPAVGPVKAISDLLEKTGMSVPDLDQVEIIESFALKVLSAIKGLSLSEAKVNQWGGALTIGHPYSASGLILLIHLFYRAQTASFRYAVAASGSGGGVGCALLVRRC